jgi:uncharacterized protein VirK/YbjX
MPFARFSSGFLMILGTLWTTLRVAESPSVAMGEWRRSVRRARKGAALLTDPMTHLQVTRVLTRREVRPVVRASPRVMFKYLTDYLKTDLSRKERASILVHHYALLGSRSHEQFFRKIAEGRLELWRESFGDHAYRILLTFPHMTDDEGDLSLVFRADETDLYVLSFTLGPGNIANLSAPSAMYIARVQGKGRALDRIRLATKDCLDISPPALLLAAAEGIALELDLEHMVGIGGKTQLSADKAAPSSRLSAYDEFWTALGGERLEGDMYHLTVPLTEKPITSIKRCHRSRVRRKRAFKALVSRNVRARFREFFVRDAAKAG